MEVERTSTMGSGGSELERARAVQLSMLPQVPKVSGLELAASYRPCDMLGGDFYDFITVDAWRLGVVMADVSGHGAAAALLMAAAKKVLQICGRACLSPKQVLLEVNDSIRADLPRGMFLSALYGLLDIRTRRFCFASAGHNPPVLMRGGKLRDTWTHKNAPVLGVLQSSDLKKHLHEEFFQLAPKDVLLLYTDGITEAFNHKKEMYGEDRLYRTIAARQGMPLQGMVEAIRGDVDGFRAGAVQTDDETVLAMHVLAAPPKFAPLLAETRDSKDNLPRFDSSLLGRDDDVAAVVELLSAGNARAVTVAGPAGAGKTRVAVAASELVRERFPGGMMYVDLASARDVAGVCNLTAAALRLGDDAASLGLRIASALEGAGSATLLLLDNCEAGAEAVGRCVQEWLTRVGHLRVVLTSRFALEFPGEAVVALRPLDTPRDGTRRESTELMALPSVALFAQRAQESMPDFRVDAGNVRDIAAIVARLDGLPQAIELAAARISEFTPKQILEKLDQRFDLLKADGQNPRGTLEGTLAWSFELLDEPEQRALMMLSVFPDGFQLDVADAVLKILPGVSPEELVRSLLRHHLLTFDRVPELKGERRFRLYESVRLLALARLTPMGALEPTRQLFERALVDYARRWWWKNAKEGSSEARRRLLIEMQSLLHVARQTQVPELRAWAAIIAAPHFNALGERDLALELVRRSLAGITEGSEEWVWVHIIDASLRLSSSTESVLEMLRELECDGVARFRKLMLMSYGTHKGGETEPAREMLQQALAIKGLSPALRARAHDRMGTYMASAGSKAEALESMQLGLRLAKESGDSNSIAQSLYSIGWFLQRGGRNAEALDYHQQCLRLAQEDGDHHMESQALACIGLNAHLLGDKQVSEASLLRALRIARELGAATLESQHLNTLTRIYHEQGRDENALQAAMRARDIARETGIKQTEAISESNVAAMLLQVKRAGPAIEALENALRLSTEIKDMRTVSVVKANLGNAWIETGRANKNRREVLKGIEMLRTGCAQRRADGFEPMAESELGLAKALIEIGQKDEARKVIDAALETLHHLGNDLSRKLEDEAEDLLAELEPSLPRTRRKRARLEVPDMSRPKPPFPRTGFTPLQPPKRPASDPAGRPTISAPPPVPAAVVVPAPVPVAATVPAPAPVGKKLPGKASSPTLARSPVAPRLPGKDNSQRRPRGQAPRKRRP